jgi:hypothetical protein
MQVKLFWKKYPLRKQGMFSDLVQGLQPAYPGRNDNPLEDEINAWLRENPHIKVVDIRQSATGGSWGPMLWLISVWYEEGDVPRNSQ